MTKATNILFVDDEPSLLEAIQRSYYDSPHTILTAPSAREAMEILRSRPVDVVVADLHMPQMNGIDLLQQVRARWPDVVRIALTGDGRATAAEQALRCGDVFRYLTKPWDWEHFETILAEAVQERDLERDASRGGRRDRPVFTLKLIHILKERLVEEGLIDRERLQRACEVAQGSDSSLGEVLLRLGYISEDLLLDFISRHAKLPRVRLADLEQDPRVLAMVPPELFERYHMLPLSRHGTRVVVAMADAADLLVADEIKAFFGIEIEPVLCSEADLNEARSRCGESSPGACGRSHASAADRSDRDGKVKCPTS